MSWRPRRRPASAESSAPFTVVTARRSEVYEEILSRFGADRVACVSMMDTYRIRHAIRDVGAALGLPPAEIDVIAKSFPHIRARDVRHALAELPG